MTKTSISILLGAGAAVCAFAASAEIVTATASKATPAVSTPIIVVPASVAQTPAPLAASAVAAAATTTASAKTATLSSVAAMLVTDKLPPLALRDMRLWNWAGVWHASEWDNPQSPISWRYNHIKQEAGTDTLFTLDASGAPELQAEGGTPAAANGLWETEVTLPKLRDGMIVAPVWLYDSSSKDEIDFEFAGRKGLDVTLHAYVNGVHKQSTARLFAGTDLSGQRKRFGIKVDQSTGFVEMYVDGERVYSWTRSGMSFFVSHPLKPWIELWAAKPTNAAFVQWAGKWAGIAGTDSAVMTVHGYRFSPLR